MTETKIPVGKTAKAVFDWLNLHAAAFQRRFKPAGRADRRNPEAAAIPHPLIFTALAVALTWALQRSWRTCLLVGLGFLFILNQGCWTRPCNR